MASPRQHHHEVSPLVFWVLGLLNNASYVIMLASAKSISEGGTALVFIANIIPSVTIKLSAPYWFDKVSYDTRIRAGAILMASSFLTVGFFQGSDAEYPLYFQLLGVSLISAQVGMGEASLLALAGASDASRSQPECVSAFASGTGLAGFLGYMFVYAFNSFMDVGMRATMLSAVSLAVAYFATYRQYLWGRKKPRGQLTTSIDKAISSMDSDELIHAPYQQEPAPMVVLEEDGEHPPPRHHSPPAAASFEDEYNLPVPCVGAAVVTKVQDMSTHQRLQLTLSLWPYIIPLFVVYAAEYILQAGTWTAIGFPIDNVQARNDFYFAANWTYYAGVFVSRSSGTLFSAPMWFLWLLPVLQCINVAFFWIVAAHHVMYNWSLLLGCFATGLLGGAVYVHGYTRICKDLPKEHTEFALSATTVGEVLGILAADVCCLYVQSCLYTINGLPGAAVACPFVVDT
jgi:battenin